MLILWCLGTAVSSTLVRSAFIYPPNPIYYTAMVLSLIGAVPLWLAVYPDLWPSESGARLAPFGWLRAGALISLTALYMSGAKAGVSDARARQAEVTWAQSYLQYYPALDNHELYLFVMEELDNFKEDILPRLIQARALPEYIKPIPFTIEVPTTFELQNTNNMEVLTAGPHRFQFIANGPNSYIVFKPAPPIPKTDVVSFTLETSGIADVTFCWNDGSGWPEEKALVLNRKGRLTTTHFGYFPEVTASDRRRNVEAIGLILINPISFPIAVTLDDIKVWAR